MCKFEVTFCFRREFCDFFGSDFVRCYWLPRSWFVLVFLTIRAPQTQLNIVHRFIYRYDHTFRSNTMLIFYITVRGTYLTYTSIMLHSIPSPYRIVGTFKRWRWSSYEYSLILLQAEHWRALRLDDIHVDALHVTSLLIDAFSQSCDS
jgi:hypothetical protein